MNPLLTPQEQAHVASVRALQHSPDAHGMDSTVSSLTAILGRIDWERVFIITARVLVSIGMLFTAYQYFHYALFFGAGALAFIGQFLIGAFFVAVVFYTRDGVSIMTAAAGMFLLANSF
ncbi:MAG: hypothetical protein L3K52_05445 [Candidatus Thiothrix sulfatifontis]|nr:MAG: hypothetical protein L3K52_05445 [Candidatus Thiothrix sulfatifontis]